jgi:hypothetical protein
MVRIRRGGCDNEPVFVKGPGVDGAGELGAGVGIMIGNDWIAEDRNGRVEGPGVGGSRLSSA